MALRMSRARRRLITLVALVAVAAMIAGAAVLSLPAFAAGTDAGAADAGAADIGAADPGPAHPGPVLLVDNPTAGRTHLLTPGVPALWDVGVTVRAATLDELTAQLRASGDLAVLGRNGTTVALESCTRMWRGQSCPGTVHRVLAATPIDGVFGGRHPLSGADPIPADVHVQARVTLGADPAPEVQGRRADLRLTVFAGGPGAPSAEPVPPGPAPEAGPEAGPGGIATTGQDVLPYLALGLGAVAAGMLLAGAARSRRRSHG